MPPAGRRVGWMRPSARRRVTVLTSRPRSLCGQHFSVSPTMSTCWWPRCTISPPTAGRSPRWCVIWGWPMPAGVRGGPPTGRHWRCSMSITRCGSAPSLVNCRIRTAASPPSWRSGSRRWPGCPSDCSCPPIGPTLRSPITVAPSVAIDWPAELQQQVRRVAREHNATSFMVIQAALAVLLIEAQRECRCGGGVRDRRARRPRAR